MEYNISRYIKTLELDKILLKLSEEASIEDASELALNIKPSSDFNEVSGRLKNTEDAYMLMARYSSPSFGRVKNPNSSIARADVGAMLSMGELLSIAQVLSAVRSLKEWHNNCTSVKNTSIDYLFEELLPNKFLEEKINFSIKSEEEMQDNASQTLYNIRRKIVAKSSSIRENLDRIVKGPSSKYLQEAIVTQRDGRFVVPVKTEFKGEISGIVHDSSSTGATLFIEPMSVVEANNEIRVLKNKEAEEINRILCELSAQVCDFADTIKKSYSALVELNLIFAKAHLAYKMKAIAPKINNKGYLYLKRARHPLIHHKKVVPISLEIGKDFDSLIITGPNTGGKTVTLKTIGLLTLMTMCGLMIPADDNSEIAIFNRIFADIGDEQSIELSLSTFSSHMVNIINITEQVDSNSLVLFDELCAGTDPVEGAALAQAILVNLLQKGVKTVATTHYPELKSYAVDTPRVENASCEFDLTTLTPTYKLIVGMLGRSNAFAISKRLGLSNEIINNAKEMVSDDDLRFERVISSLEKAKLSAEKERQKAATIRKELQEEKQKTDANLNELRIKQEKLIEQTRERADVILEDARYRSALLLNQLEDLKKEMNSANASDIAAKARAEHKRLINELEDKADPVIKVSDYKEKIGQPPLKGDIVIIDDFNKEATVIDVKGNKAFVISGSIKMWVDFDNLRKSKKKAVSTEKKTRKISGVTSRKDRNVSGEIDIRGMASDEAIMELEKYLDEAILSGINTVTIIHGKGTGVLRKAVHSYLRNNKFISNFRVGLFGEGENGVTIAEIKN